MAISLPSATISPLTSDNSCNFISSKTSSSPSITCSSLSKLPSSSLSSLQVQFPWQLRRQLCVGNTRSSNNQHSHILLVAVAAHRNADQLLTKHFVEFDVLSTKENAVTMGKTPNVTYLPKRNNILLEMNPLG